MNEHTVHAINDAIVELKRDNMQIKDGLRLVAATILAAANPTWNVNRAWSELEKLEKARAAERPFPMHAWTRFDNDGLFRCTKCGLLVPSLDSVPAEECPGAQP